MSIDARAVQIWHFASIGRRWLAAITARSGARSGLSGQAGADGGSGAADRVEVVVEDANDVGSGQDDPQLEGELSGVGAVWQFALVGGGAGFPGEQVTPLLLDAGYFVVNPARLCAYLGGCRDEEAPAREDPPLDVGQVALT